MIKILFVDDEPMVLQGMQRAFRPMRNEWSMAFADSGPHALDVLAQSPFDVVVSDMRMAPMDGADLLNKVMELYPGTVRIILSGHSERGLIMKSVGAAHQYLAKPCDPEELKNVVQKTTKLNQILTNQQLRALTARLDRLPSMPALYTQIRKVLQKPDANTDEVAELISHDIAMTAEILKVVNSAFFGLANHISCPFEAVRFLGLETIKTLVLVVHLCSKYAHLKVGSLDVSCLWEHSYRVATLARQIAILERLDAKMTDETFSAALLHDLGKIVLAANIPCLCDEVERQMLEHKLSLCEAEREVLGATHAEVGGYLLGLWGLPTPLVEAVAYHHCPGLSQSNTLSPLAFVHAADALAYCEDNCSHNALGANLDTQYMESLGLLARYEQWKLALIRPPAQTK